MKRCLFLVELKWKLLLVLLVFFSVEKTYAQSNQWTWMSGDSSLINTVHGIYGTKGVSNAANRPGRRKAAATWKDASGNFWLFGGEGFATKSNASSGYLNDLWKFNPAISEWTWVSGDSTLSNLSNYGSITIASATNKPGGRYRSMSWIDASGNFWLFGGTGFDFSGLDGSLNDLWKYTPGTNQWTWMKGDNTGSISGVYGTINVTLATNKPGGRYESATWIDGSGNLYMLGGYGKASTAAEGYLNDLWKYNIATNNWTWIKGDNTIDIISTYGTLGTAAAGNKPGGRYGSIGWKDATGKFYLLGGYGRATTTSTGYLNDLFRYDPVTNNWTWIKGDNTINHFGIYGTQGVAAAGNFPGSRLSGTGWTDASGNFWLMGGEGFAATGSNRYLNDLWKYTVSTGLWTWVKGDKSTDRTGVYGTQGTEASSNKPGSRFSAAAWTDGSGFLWLFGGRGLGMTFSTDHLYDLWKFNTSTNNWTWVKGEMINEQPGFYGIKGAEAQTNKPPGRSGSTSWTDNNGDLWLFGGTMKGTPSDVLLNDLWRYKKSTGLWTWIGGDNTGDVAGIYGTIGVAAAGNKPGSRDGAASWKDASGNLWLFGGYGKDIAGNIGYLNDLWKYNVVTNQWTWVKGDQSSDNAGIYGTKGIAAASNNPGARSGTAFSVSPSGDFWLFGGEGYDNIVDLGFGYLNDIWKYNPSTNLWTWVEGDNTVNNYSVYGTLGIAAPGIKPGARTGSTGAIDQSGDFWILGGYGNSSVTSFTGYLNDLWKFSTSTSQWTWHNGDTTADNTGIYGLKGISGFANKPPALSNASAWLDNSGNVWMFGGTDGNNHPSNTLWKYKPSINQWAWISGNDLQTSQGIYGTRGVADPANSPGVRNAAAFSKDLSGDFWIYGGQGYEAGSGSLTSQLKYLNDLWKFTPSSCVGDISITPLSGSFCTTTSILLTATGGSTYEWYKDGVIIPGESGPTYSATSNGSYYVKSSLGTCIEVYSNEVIIGPGSVRPALGGTGVYCVGDFVNVGIPQTEVDQNYTWLRNNSAVYGPIGGNGGNQSLGFSMSTLRVGTYIVQSSKPGCTVVNSNNVYVGLAAITNLIATAVCSNDVSFTWDRVVPTFVSQLYEYAVTTSPIPPAGGTSSNSNLQTVASLSPSTTYYIHVRSGCGFGFTNFGDWSTISFTTTSSPLPVATAEWTGALNTDWFNTANWKCGFIPITTTAVIIPGGKPNYPILYFDATIKSLDVKPGASVEVNDGIKLTITSQ